MTKYLAGRRFYPAALCLTITLVTSAWARLTNHTDPVYTIVGVLALLAGALLTVSWLLNRWGLMRWGLLVATFVWVFAAGSSWTVIHSNVSAINALALAILAGGSYWLESEPEDHTP